MASTLVPPTPAPRIRWADMCDDLSTEELEESEQQEQAVPASIVKRDVNELVHDSETAGGSVLPGESSPDPTVAVVMPPREQERSDAKEQGPPVVLWHGAIDYDPTTGEPFLIYTSQYDPVVLWHFPINYDPTTGEPFLIYPSQYGPVAHYYAPCETWMVSPDWKSSPIKKMCIGSDTGGSVSSVPSTRTESALSGPIITLSVSAGTWRNE